MTCLSGPNFGLHARGENAGDKIAGASSVRKAESNDRQDNYDGACSDYAEAA